MNIDEKIKEIAEKHMAIISENDSISEIQYRIEGVPYKEFNEWRQRWNKNNEERRYKEENSLSDRLYIMLFPWDINVDKARIDVYSVPVKFKHTYTEVEEIISDSSCVASEQ